MRVSNIMGYSQSPKSRTIRKHTPWIASPLDSEAERIISHHGEPENSVSNGQNHPIRHDVQQLHPHDSDIHIFKEHHESSFLELFYDLFFVANLSTFTTTHDIVDVKSLKNYIGFFTILWFTWLEISLFDIHFYADSIFSRICKSISFCVMTGFAACGVLYDTTQTPENAKIFRMLSIILIVSRLTLVAQYVIVLWYVKEYKEAFLPLAATTASLFVAAMVFLATFFGFRVSAKGNSFPMYYIWYIVVCLETLAVISFSCRWRVISFKNTHLVERLGLLTLIIMGEGIIGMTKSVSQILQNSNIISIKDIATVLSAVLLIYFIWFLYFDQIENDRFGTISQQFWAILHYPLHVAMLLTVEGSTTSILWNIFVEFDNYWWGLYNNITNPNYTSDDQLISSIQGAIDELSRKLKTDNLTQLYDYNQSLTLIGKQNIQSTGWSNETTQIVQGIWVGIENVLFTNFGISAASEKDDRTETQDDENSALWNTVDTALTYFYASAGSFLIILAVMYWLGKKHKLNEEYVSVVVRVVAGIGIILTLPPLYLEYHDDFVGSPWIIPVVVLGYFVVIVLDNFLTWHLNKKLKRQASNNEQETFSLTESLIGVAV